eukprot:gene15901-7233_t
MDYMDLTSKDNIDNETSAALQEIATALKSRPMRSLRGFSKRRFGTAPTILGTYGLRKDLESVNGTIHSIQSEQYLAGDVTLHDNEEFALDLGEFIIFRGSDGWIPNGKGALCPFHMYEEDQIFAVELSLCLPTLNESPDTVRYRMEGEIYSLIQPLPEKFEKTLQQDMELPDGDVLEDISDVFGNFETGTQLTYTDQRERTGRGGSRIATPAQVPKATVDKSPPKRSCASVVRNPPEKSYTAQAAAATVLNIYVRRSGEVRDNPPNGRHCPRSVCLHIPNAHIIPSALIKRLTEAGIKPSHLQRLPNGDLKITFHTLEDKVHFVYLPYVHLPRRNWEPGMENPPPMDTTLTNARC